jgi:hypothetical protein
MASSINGWPVLQPTSAQLVTKTVPGTSRKIRMREDVIPLFLALAADYHRSIAKIDVGPVDDWGYAYRQSRLSSAWSDHSSGTAFDLNASEEGRQGTGPLTWWKTSSRYLKSQALKKKYALVIWGGASDLGGDYTQSKNWDWMHWALKPGTTVADVQAQIKKLRIRPDGTVAPVTPPPPPPLPVVAVAKVQPGMTNSQVLIVQKALKKEYPLFDYSTGPGTFGPKTQAFYKVWETRSGTPVPNVKPDFNSLTRLGRKYGFKVVA